MQVQFTPSETQERFIRSSVLENCFMGPRGEGKGVPYNTELLTPLGFVKAKNIKVGDSLVSVDGFPAKVVGVYPQPPKKMWEISFSDKTAVICTDDHLWAVETSWDREGGAKSDKRDRTGRGKTERKCSNKFARKRRDRKIVSTQDIVNSVESGKWKNGGRWSIPLTYPVHFDKRDVPVDPYVLGILLGDGHLPISGSVSFASADKEIIAAVDAGVPYGMRVVSDTRKYCYRIVGSKNPLHKALLHLNLLGSRAWEKFIPDMYLWNDVETRLSVLQGLLDTDGTISKHSNSVSFSTTSQRLAAAVKFIIQSLGGLAEQRERKTQYTYKGEKRTGRISYHISVRLPNGISPFRLSRKSNLVSDKGERNRPKRYIVGIKRVKARESVCFSVDHQSGLFLMKDFIVTHNTDAGIMAMSYHASLIPKKYRPVPWAIIRDTWKNLERTTYRSIMYPTNPKSFTYQVRNNLHQRDGGRQITLTSGGKPVWIAFLFGMDTPEDLNQVLSMQLGGLWLEEAAPAMQEDIGAGLSEETWTMGITSLRHPIMSSSAVEFLKEWDKKFDLMTPADIKHGIELGAMVRTIYDDVVPLNRRAQMTMNYPSEDHWSWVRFYDEEDPTMRALFRIPRGENIHLDDQYRRNMELSLKNRPDLTDRLVIGRPAHVQLGIAVTPEYHETLNGGPWHRANVNYDPMPNLTVFRFWDGDLHPSCHFGQITPRGKYIGLDTIRSVDTGEGMKQFVDTKVKPLLADRYSKVSKWRDLGDPTLNDRDPSDSSQTAANIIEKELNTTYEGGILRWGARKEALKEILTKTLSNGEPMFSLSKHDRVMHRSLSGGWHYNKSASGKVSDEPDNADINSHPAAGFSHGLAKIFKYEREARIKLPATRKKVAVASSVQTLHR